MVGGSKKERVVVPSYSAVECSKTRGRQFIARAWFEGRLRLCQLKLDGCTGPLR